MRTRAALFFCLAVIGLPGLACAQSPPPIPERGSSDKPATEKQILEKLTKMIKQVEGERPKLPLHEPTPTTVTQPPTPPAPIPPTPTAPLAPTVPQIPPGGAPLTPWTPPIQVAPVDPPLPPMPNPVPNPVAPTPAHVRIRDVLNKPITLNHTAKDFPEALAHLRERTGVHFVLDPAALRVLNAPEGNRPPIVFKATDVRLRVALSDVLTQHYLGYAVVGETVLITTDREAGNLRLRQLVQIDVKNTPLKTVLRQLGADTGVNVVLDPRLRSAKLESEPITLNVQEVALHNAVRLLAEFANLRSVQVGDVLVVTTPEHAARMCHDNPTPAVVNVSGAFRTN
jgi:hypothetical protein